MDHKIGLKKPLGLKMRRFDRAKPGAERWLWCNTISKYWLIESQFWLQSKLSNTGELPDMRKDVIRRNKLSWNLQYKVKLAQQGKASELAANLSKYSWYRGILAMEGYFQQFIQNQVRNLVVLTRNSVVILWDKLNSYSNKLSVFSNN